MTHDKEVNKLDGIKKCKCKRTENESHFLTCDLKNQTLM